MFQIFYRLKIHFSLTITKSKIVASTIAPFWWTILCSASNESFDLIQGPIPSSFGVLPVALNPISEDVNRDEIYIT